MITGSGRWMPPPLPAIRSPEHEKDSGTIFAAGRSRRVELERTLTDPQMNEFEDRLCALALERSQIKEAMGFALGSADAAGEIVEVLTESLTLKETPMPTKDAGTAMRPLSAAVTAAGGNASYVLDGVPRILSPAYFHHYNARLMPADLDTWKQKRRVIAPGFHALYLEAMTKVFTECLEIAILKFEKFLEGGHLHGGKTIELDLEAEFSNLALNIMELGVFNYDFGSVTKESPVIRAVYGTLFEAEHRSTFYIPYWKVPLARWIGHRQQRRRGGLGQVLCQKP